MRGDYTRTENMCNCDNIRHGERQGCSLNSEEGKQFCLWCQKGCQHRKGN